MGIRKYCCSAREGVTALPAARLSKAFIYVGFFFFLSFCPQLLWEGLLVFVQSLLACLTPVSSPDVYVPSSSRHICGSALGKPRRFQNWRFVFSKK